jgi:hypothetical protein
LLFERFDCELLSYARFEIAWHLKLKIQTATFTRFCTIKPPEAAHQKGGFSISGMPLGKAIPIPIQLPQVIQLDSFGVSVNKANINGTGNIYGWGNDQIAWG